MPGGVGVSLQPFLHSPDNPRLNYTIIYNATRALKLAQLVFGSPNKPDGRMGMECICNSMCTFICMYMYMHHYYRYSVHVYDRPILTLVIACMMSQYIHVIISPLCAYYVLCFVFVFVFVFVFILYKLVCVLC